MRSFTFTVTIMGLLFTAAGAGSLIGYHISTIKPYADGETNRIAVELKGLYDWLEVADCRKPTND